MKLAGSQSSRRIRYLGVIVLSLLITAMPTGRAADTVENFGSGTCAIQSAGLSITQSGTTIGATDAHTKLTLSKTYTGMYGLVGCYLQFNAINPAGVITFPTTSRPDHFSFLKSAVDWAQAGRLTYVDATSETFTVGVTSSGTSATQTVTGNGKAISSVEFYNDGTGVDYWFLDNLTWSAAVPQTSTTQITNVQYFVEKGKPTTLFAAVSTPGRVSFKANGKNIPGCAQIPTNNLTAQCAWRPPITGSVSILASLSPTDLNKPGSASVKIISVVRRSTLR